LTNLIATQINQLMRILLSLFFTFILSSAYCNLDSLKNIFTTQKDTNAVLAGYELGKKYAGIDLDSSLNYLRSSAHLADELKFVAGQKGIYRALGALCVRAGGYEESLEWLEKGLALIEENDLPKVEKVDMLTNLGVVHSYAGKNGRAIEPYLEAVQICRENGLITRQGRLLNNLGAFYRQLGNYEKALDIYEQSYELRATTNDTLGMANVLFNRTATHAKLSNFEEAINDIDKALIFYQKIGSEEDIVPTKVAKAHALYNLGKTDQSYDLLLPLSKIPIDDIPSLSQFNLYLLLAEISDNSNDPRRAINYLEVIGKKIESSDYNEQLAQYYRVKSNANAKIGNHKVAYKAAQQLINTQSEVSGTQKLAFQEEMQARYESAEKDYQIDLLNNEKALSELKIKTQRTRSILLGIGLAILSIVLFLLYKLYQKIAVQNQKLQKSEKQKSILLKEIHHRVRNNLQVISSLLSLQARKVKDDTTKAALRVSKSRVQSMAILHQNLYTEDDLTNINVHQYISNLCDNLINTYQVKNEVAIELNVAKMMVDVDALIPIGLIINEIVCNTLKYAFTDENNGKIQISFMEVEDHVALNIRDNGVGLPNGKLEIKKESLGAKLINSFMDRLGGKLIAYNDQGAVFEMRFPKEVIFANKYEDNE